MGNVLSELFFLLLWNLKTRESNTLVECLTFNFLPILFAFFPASQSQQYTQVTEIILSKKLFG